MPARLLLLAPLLLLGACALPIEGAPSPTVEPDDARVFDRGDEPALEAAPERFSFVVEAGGPRVVLATLFDERLVAGDPSWARAPWLTPELAVQSDVDVDAVPLELLVRQGEPFVTTTPDGEICVGYLGELSVVRLIHELNVGEVAELSEREYEELWDLDREGPPTSERLHDPAFVWQAAANRSYLVADLESLDDCAHGAFGAHADVGATTFVRSDASRHDDEARRMFRAHPDYASMQDDYDRWRRDAWGGSTEEWPAGPWETATFVAIPFAAADGREMVLAHAANDAGCSGAPGNLAVLYDVSDDGTLTHRRDLVGLDYTSTMAIVEDAGGSILVTPQIAFAAEDLAPVQDVSPLATGCSC